MLRFPIHEQNVFLHSLRGPFIGSRSVGHTVLHLFHQIDTEVFRFLSTRKWCRIFHFGVRVFVASSLKYDWVSCIYFVSRNLAKLIRWSQDVFSVDSPGCSAAGFLPFHRACFSCPSPTLQPCPGPAALRRVRTAAGDTFALSLSSRGKRSVCHKESALSHGACVFIESWLRSWFSGGFIRNRCRILSHAFSRINRYDRVISLLWPVICSGWYWLILNIAFQEFLGYGT